MSRCVATHSPGWSCSPSWSCWLRRPRCSTPGYSAPRWRPPAGWSAPGGQISGCQGHLPVKRGWARTPRCPHLEQHRVSTHRCLPSRPDPVRSPRPRAGSRGRPRSGRARRSSTRRMAAGTRFTCVRDVIIAINYKHWWCSPWRWRTGRRAWRPPPARGSELLRPLPWCPADWSPAGPGKHLYMAHVIELTLLFTDMSHSEDWTHDKACCLYINIIKSCKSKVTYMWRK